MKISFEYDRALNYLDDTETGSAFKRTVEEIVITKFNSISNDKFFAEDNGFLIVGYYNDFHDERKISIIRITILI